MLALAWANLTHHGLRSALSALAVGLGLALFLVSRGMARGSIGEVAERMQSVSAEVIVLPSQANMVFSGGAAFVPEYEPYLAGIADDQGPLAAEVIPVFWWQAQMGGQQQRLFGVHPAQMSAFLGHRKILEGKPFDRAWRLSEYVDAQRAVSDAPATVTPEQLEDGLELIIDDTLRKVGDNGREYRIGDRVQILGREFRIVGVVESGVAGRVFAPIETMRHILNAGEPQSSMFFLRLRDGLDPAKAVGQLGREAGSGARAQLTSDYGSVLNKELARVYMYINATNTLALVVCFLFILLTMYTFVLERTREIGVLKSLGVTRFGLLRLSMIEALLISGAGVVIGVSLAFAAKAAMAVKLPLLFVDLSAGQLGAAVAIGLVGGLVSALYPGWRAAKLEPAVALSYE